MHTLLLLGLGFVLGVVTDLVMHMMGASLARRHVPGYRYVLRNWGRGAQVLRFVHHEVPPDCCGGRGAVLIEDGTTSEVVISTLISHLQHHPDKFARDNCVSRASIDAAVTLLMGVQTELGFR